MATGFPVKANYATGDVLTAANMNDLSGTVNYLQYMPPRNAILNSNFSVWQRGTSISYAASTNQYSADRWQAITGANQASTISRQATGDTTNLPNIQYALRLQRNSGQTGTGSITLAQSFESVNSIPFAGKAVTYSFWARSGANYSPTSSNLQVVVWTGTGTDQNIISGFTGQAVSINVQQPITTTWTRYTFTATLPTTATQIATGFLYTPTGTAGAADYFEITGVQLELGSSANSYMPNQPTYATELAACQRYYYRANADAAYTVYGLATTKTTTTGQGMIQLPVKLRALPTSVDFANLGYIQTSNDTTYAISNAVLSTSLYSTNMLVVDITIATITANQNGRLASNNSTSGYIGCSAEL